MLWPSMSVIDELSVGCKAEGILELPRRVKEFLGCIQRPRGTLREVDSFVPQGKSGGY
jgi:hypothetical protein